MQIVHHPDSKCNKCGTPFIAREVPFMDKKTIMTPACNCYGQAWQEEQDSIRMKKIYKKCGIPKKYQDEDMTDWIKIPGTEELTNMLRDYVKNLKSNLESGSGIFLSGMKGTGKTKCLCYVANKYMSVLKAHVRYISMSSYITEIEKMKKNKAVVSDYIKLLINIPILVIDDVGESKTDEWNLRYIFLLLDGRNNRKCVTLTNTMQHIEKCNDFLGHHNVSRLLEMAGSNVVEISSTVDMRPDGNKKKYGLVKK